MFQKKSHPVKKKKKSHPIPRKSKEKKKRQCKCLRKKE